MIVRLSHAQARAIGARLDPIHALAMSTHREVYGKTQHSYDLPAIAWRQIRDRLVETAFGPRGGRTSREPASVYAGLTRISKAVLRMEHHPALFGKAARGWSGEVIPAWPDGDVFQPYPNDGRMGLLVPAHLTVKGHHVTVWRTGLTGHSSWTFHPDAHTMFSDRLPLWDRTDDRLAGEG